MKYAYNSDSVEEPNSKAQPFGWAFSYLLFAYVPASLCSQTTFVITPLVGMR